MPVASGPNVTKLESTTSVPMPRGEVMMKSLDRPIWTSLSREVRIEVGPEQHLHLQVSC